MTSSRKHFAHIINIVLFRAPVTGIVHDRAPNDQNIFLLQFIPINQKSPRENILRMTKSLKREHCNRIFGLQTVMKEGTNIS
jgi:hypothetical protein